MSGYAEAVADFRRRKDEHFAAGRGPVDPQTFAGLSYYAPDETWSFHVPLEPAPADAPETAVLETNTGATRVMALYGQVRLTLPGGERSLSVFAPPGEDGPQRVFIPFRDATSGPETYGAGRYLDAPLTRGEGGVVWVSVDFNLAYHPYCAYGDGWTCPLPPAGNTLPDAVRAGERLPAGA